MDMHLYVHVHTPTQIHIPHIGTGTLGPRFFCFFLNFILLSAVETDHNRTSRQELERVTTEEHSLLAGF